MIKPNLTIIIVSDTVRSTGRKRVKEITSGRERLDVISRCLLNAIRFNNRLNYNIKFILYLSHPNEQKALIIPISTEIHLSSELDALIFLITCFTSKSKGVHIEKSTFEEIIRDFASDALLFYLHPDGVAINRLYHLIDHNDSLVFVIGSQKDLTLEQEKVLYKFGNIKLSLGSKNYLASHVVTLLLHHLELTPLGPL